MTRREERRRRRPSTARKLRPFWFLIASAIAVAAVALYVLAVWPALDPHSVEVFGDTVVPKAEILARAQIDPNRNMFLQNTRAMAARIEAIPYVATARVHRRLPDTMTIVVTERVPYAFIESGGIDVTVDRAMRVLQTGVPPDRADSLPVFATQSTSVPAPGAFVTDPDVNAFEAIEDQLQSAQIDARRVAYDRFGDVDVTLRNGILIQLGDRTIQLEEKIAMIEPVLAKVDRGKRKVAAIDLRAPTTPVVVYAK
jgi:cell division protein FtsQ